MRKLNKVNPMQGMKEPNVLIMLLAKRKIGIFAVQETVRTNPMSVFVAFMFCSLRRKRNESKILAEIPAMKANRKTAMFSRCVTVWKSTMNFLSVHRLHLG